jgi:PBSX family phage terminase large subunit
MKSDFFGEVWCKGGRGSTKSSFISIEIILGIIKNKGSNALVCRRYDNELRDSVFGQLRWAATKLEVDHLFRFMVSPMQAVYVPTGQQIIFKGADNPLKIKSINLGHGYIKYAWFEEVDQFGGFEEVRNILQSIFRGENRSRVALFSYNPPRSARSWVNQEVKIEKPGRFVHSSDYRNINTEWLGDRFLADAEHLRVTNNLAYRHEYLGEEVGTGLEVFNNITIRTILESEIKAFDHIRQGLDFGYAVDPLSFERMHYDAKKRRLYLFREEAGIGISNRVLASKLTTEEKREFTRADSAEPKSVDELRLDFNMRVVGAKKGPGSVENGVKWLADLEEIIIDPLRCPLAAKEFVNYSLEVNRTGEVVSKYPDKENHSIDSVRYACEDLIGVHTARRVSITLG